MTRTPSSSRGRRGITLIEMLVAMIASSVILTAMGTLFTQTVMNYRNAVFLSESCIGQASGDMQLRNVLMAASLAPGEKRAIPPFNNPLPATVNAAGVIIAPRAFAYNRVELPAGGGSLTVPPALFSIASQYTGLVYWYRNSATSLPCTESTPFNESVVYWFEVPRNRMTTWYALPADSFTSGVFTDAVILGFQNNPNFRKASRVISRNVADFFIDDSLSAINGAVNPVPVYQYFIRMLAPTL